MTKKILIPFVCVSVFCAWGIQAAPPDSGKTATAVARPAAQDTAGRKVDVVPRPDTVKAAASAIKEKKTGHGDSVRHFIREIRKRKRPVPASGEHCRSVRTGT
jgi:hypothetical protein